jgi:methylthioribulose-1-phosphate dehydratase
MVRREAETKAQRWRGPQQRKGAAESHFNRVATELADIGRSFYQRGWMLGTSGNLSCVVSRQPLRLAITATGLDKGALSVAKFLEIDEAARVVRGTGEPSSESKVHLAIARARGAGAVLHTHSVWSTIISEAFARDGGVSLEGFEMLKGLEGVRSHEHREWLPILENCQDMARLAGMTEALLEQHPRAHAFLLQRHGLYAWGQDLAEAKRHVEILEFLLEVVGRSRTGEPEGSQRAAQTARR